MSTICGVGIDVSARELTVSVASKTTQSFENNAKGHRAISRLVLRCAKGDVQICVEATGSYSLDLCFHLQSCGLRVMVANPRAVSNFAKAMMSRSKTDPMDAEVLREFAERMPFVEWVPPAQAALELRAASRRLDSLSNMLTREKNRLHAARATKTTISIVSDDLKSSIKHFEGRMERLIKKIESFIKTEPLLHARYRRLQTVRGIAARSAIRLLGELATMPADMSPKQCVAHAGLDPRQHQSGSSIDRPARISKRGNRYLRSALYMPAVVASQHDPIIKAFYERLLEKGKKPLQALVAIMRKLLHGIIGMLKTGTDFDAQRLFPNIRVQGV
jgi:transposase